MYARFRHLHLLRCQWSGILLEFSITYPFTGMGEVPFASEVRNFYHLCEARRGIHIHLHMPKVHMALRQRALRVRGNIHSALLHCHPVFHLSHPLNLVLPCLLSDSSLHCLILLVPLHFHRCLAFLLGSRCTDINSRVFGICCPCGHCFLGGRGSH